MSQEKRVERLEREAAPEEEEQLVICWEELELPGVYRVPGVDGLWTLEEIRERYGAEYTAILVERDRRTPEQFQEDRRERFGAPLQLHWPEETL